jgi:hypothetical protein
MPWSRPASAALLGLSLLAASHRAQADLDGRRKLSLSENGEVELRLPEDWKSSREPDPRPGVRTYGFEPSHGKPFKVLISTGFAPQRRDPRHWVEGAARSAAGQSIEGRPKVESLCPTEGIGYYFKATDRAPKPGEFRLMTQGALTSGDWAVMFTVLSNGDGGRPEESTLLALHELACDSAPPASAARAQPSDSALELSFPGAGWRLHLALPGFQIEARERYQDGHGEMLRATNEKTGVVLSAFVLREPGPQTAESCRERYWPSAVGSPIAKTDVRRSQRGDMAIGEYTIDLGTESLPDRHMNAYLGAQDGCVDVHLSKLPFEDGDAAVFAEVLRGVSLRR